MSPLYQVLYDLSRVDIVEILLHKTPKRHEMQNIDPYLNTELPKACTCVEGEDQKCLTCRAHYVIQQQDKNIRDAELRYKGAKGSLDDIVTQYRYKTEGCILQDEEIRELKIRIQYLEADLKGMEDRV